MTTFPAGEQTHQAVLPQQPALESVRADTPGSRDETAHGHPADARGTGRGHGRGETGRRGTAARRRHAESAAQAAKEAENGSGDAPPNERPYQGGMGAPRAFVLSRDGHPLMPCHPARARELLGRGRAVVARQVPFTIRLKDRTRAIRRSRPATPHRPGLQGHRPRPHRRDKRDRRSGRVCHRSTRHVLGRASAPR